MSLPFTARKEFVYRGAVIVCRAISKTMAKRIANALNLHKPNKEGV